MAAAPPHCWPSASAAILFSTEMALAVLGSLLLSLLLPAVPPSLASRPSAPLVSLATAAAQPPFFLKGRVKEREEGGYGARPYERRLGGPTGTQTGGLGPAAPPPEALLICSGRRGRSPRGAGVLAGRGQRPGRGVGRGVQAQGAGRAEARHG